GAGVSGLPYIARYYLITGVICVMRERMMICGKTSMCFEEERSVKRNAAAVARYLPHRQFSNTTTKNLALFAFDLLP
ncbi:MAG: hypothetical protein ABF553_09525, partial [Acetobacter orientalis]|uniref:hypothetical protein n=1 Tax=Acetobacter orientalis TaxID=146474 RepID=UPI0039EBF2DE